MLQHNKSIEGMKRLIEKILLTIIQDYQGFSQNVQRLATIALSTSQVEAVLSTLNSLFQDWLASDSVQFLMEKARDMTVHDEEVATNDLVNNGQYNSDEYKEVVEDLTKACFCLLVMRMLKLNTKSVSSPDRNSSQEMDDSDENHEDDVMSIDNIEEMMKDLVTMLLGFKQYLFKLDHSHKGVFIKRAHSLYRTDSYLMLQQVKKCLVRYTNLSTFHHSKDDRSVEYYQEQVQIILYQESPNNEIIAQLIENLVIELYYLGKSKFDCMLAAHYRHHLLEEDASVIVDHIIVYINLLSQLMKLPGYIYYENINLFLCELLGVIITALAMILGHEHDIRVGELLLKQLDICLFAEQIRHIGDHFQLNLVSKKLLLPPPEEETRPFEESKMIIKGVNKLSLESSVATKYPEPQTQIRQLHKSYINLPCLTVGIWGKGASSRGHDLPFWP
jgi:hypothetical protein